MGRIFLPTKMHEIMLMHARLNHLASQFVLEDENAFCQLTKQSRVTAQIMHYWALHKAIENKWRRATARQVDVILSSETLTSAADIGIWLLRSRMSSVAIISQM